jgi:hypothetical protein
LKNSKWLFIILLLFETNISSFCQQKMETLVFIDESDSLSIITKTYLLPYLDHFGIVYELADINTKKLSKRADNYSLVIIGHDMIIAKTASKLIKKIISKGGGVVSFDPDWTLNNMESQPSTVSAKLIYFNNGHYITSLHEKTDTIKSLVKIPLRDLSADIMKPLVFADGKPLLLISETGKQRCVVFTSMDWMNTHFVGPMMGLDDCLWRSFVWAARKPFVMRGLPPLVTMRVDDVAGRGELMQKSPLYWVKTANKYGFKPWLGLFIYNLSPVAVEELRGYILSNQATASPHAFGRPNRAQMNNKPTESYTGSDFVQTDTRFYYDPDAFPLRAKSYDEFIYFDHQKRKPWNDEEAIRGLEAVDKWYAKNQPLPMSKYFLAHWYEMGSNIIPHVSQKWGMEYIGINKAIDTPYADSIPWIKGAPFRLHENPGTVTNNSALRGMKAVYYSDFIDINGNKFFNSLTEIRDDAGYEWAPDNDVKASADRGIRQLSRALNSMALAVLFTHETDFIYRIQPEKWDKELQLITVGIKSYNPVYLTMDDALKIVRTTKTSKLNKIETDNRLGVVKTEFTGNSDVKSYFYIFTEKEKKIDQRLVEIPLFNNRIEIVTKL